MEKFRGVVHQKTIDFPIIMIYLRCE